MKEHEDGFVSWCNYCQDNTVSHNQGDCIKCNLSKTSSNLSLAKPPPEKSEGEV